MAETVLCKLERKEQLRSYGSGDKAGTLIKFTVLLKGFKNKTELDMTAFNDKATFIDDTAIGTELKIEGYTFSKDNNWNGKTWRSTEFRMNSVEVYREEDFVHAGGKQADAMYPNRPQVQQPQFDDDGTDDLPF